MSSNASEFRIHFGTIGIVFVILKLTGVITWSWWWVLSPFYLPFLFVFIVAGLMAIWVILFGE